MLTPIGMGAAGSCRLDLGAVSGCIIKTDGGCVGKVESVDLRPRAAAARKWPLAKIISKPVVVS